MNWSPTKLHARTCVSRSPACCALRADVGGDRRARPGCAASRLRKKGQNRLLTRAAQKRCPVFAAAYRAATVRVRSRPAFFRSLLERRDSICKGDQNLVVRLAEALRAQDPDVRARIQSALVFLANGREATRRRMWKTRSPVGGRSGGRPWLAGRQSDSRTALNPHITARSRRGGPFVETLGRELRHRMSAWVDGEWDSVKYKDVTIGVGAKPVVGLPGVVPCAPSRTCPGIQP
jgi:hypothetical protein